MSMASTGSPGGSGMLEPRSKRSLPRNRSGYNATAPLGPTDTTSYPSYLFEVPTQPTETRRVLKLDEETRSFSGDVKTETKRTGTSRLLTETTKVSHEMFHETRTDSVQITITPTNFMQEWKTPPLWGVRDSAPYMHDGRAETMLQAITMHEGEAAMTRDRFLNLSVRDRKAVEVFLNTLVAPKNAPETNL